MGLVKNCKKIQFVFKIMISVAKFEIYFKHNLFMLSKQCLNKRIFAHTLQLVHNIIITA